MPLEDPDRCGRIRDNIAIAIESAEAKLIALQAFDDNVKMHDKINTLLGSVSQTVLSFGQQYDEAKYQGSVHTARVVDDLLSEFAHLGMSEQQENLILKMVEDRSNSLIKIYQTLLDKQRHVLDTLGRNHAESQADYPAFSLHGEVKSDTTAQTSATSDTTFF
jgi:hypothetical protein